MVANMLVNIYVNVSEHFLLCCSTGMTVAQLQQHVHLNCNNTQKHKVQMPCLTEQ